MKPLTIRDAPAALAKLHREIRRSEESRYHHRLHAILLVARGMTARQVAELLGDAPRTVQYWVKRFQDQGLTGLEDSNRPGRPARLTHQQLAQIAAALPRDPKIVGVAADSWDGHALSDYVRHRYRVSLGVRQCQRVLRGLKRQLIQDAAARGLDRP